MYSGGMYPCNNDVGKVQYVFCVNSHSNYQNYPSDVNMNYFPYYTESNYNTNNNQVVNVTASADYNLWQARSGFYNNSTPPIPSAKSHYVNHNKELLPSTPSNASECKSNVGMSLLKKMGWNPGEGLGKFKDGQLEPLQVKGKYGKLGLMSHEEYKKEQQNVKLTGLGRRARDFPKPALKDKHPVTALMEYSAKNHLMPPVFKSYLEEGVPISRYLMSVIFQDVEYKPSQIFQTKKDAKKAAALLCLQQLGVV